MKRLFLLLLLVIPFLPVMAQGSDSSKPKTVMLPGNGRIDVEKFIGKINLDMDISKLNLCELRVLRNAFAARQGFCFMEGDLRSIYEATSWYDSIACNRADAEKPAPIKYSAAEQAFINRVKQRENELKMANFKAPNGSIVNMNNIINPFQLETYSAPLYSMLGKYGFAVVPRKNMQLFHIYENNDYHDFPNFVTTDLYLQLFHAYFDFLLRDVEEAKFTPRLLSFSKQMYTEMMKLSTTGTSKAIKDAAAFNAAYYAIGYSILSGLPMLPVPAAYRSMATVELKNISALNDSFSDFLDYHDALFMYSTFRPRGHYTRTTKLKRYFKAMMWFQTAPFCAERPAQLRKAILQASVIGSNAALTKAYKDITEPITYLMGQPDNVTIMQLYDVMKSGGYTLSKLMTDDTAVAQYSSKIVELAKKQTRILPKQAISCLYKVNLMPQRYMPDAEVMQEMVDVKTQPNTKRATPKGLDVFAAFGSTAAERILLGELKEGEKWEDYTANLNRMKQQMKSVDWNMTVSNRWMGSLNALLNPDGRYPYFMKTPQWDKKNLNTALASWSELKHDAILYAKQPMAAECGGGGLPDPVIVGYVEPNVAYWQKAIALLQATQSTMMKFNLFTERNKNHTTSLLEMAQSMLNASLKELAGKTLSEEEYKSIEVIGSSIELLTLDFVKQSNQHLQSWDDVQGADKSISVVADVYTSNASNNKSQSVLYEGVGHANEMYVVVEIGGYLYLTRGAVFSYREFTQPLASPRLTDEEWQNKLKTNPLRGVPSWMNEITLPDNSLPVDNENFCYSSGC